MKEIHKKLLELAQTQDLGDLTYREIGSMIGGEHPYQVQYNITQLLKEGALLKNQRSGSIYLAGTPKSPGSLLSIPVLGNVSCGVATEIANDEYYGSFISVSPSLINAKSPKRLFALKASGDSMNAANIAGDSVDDGDFVIVRQCEWGDAKNGDYVVSLIGDCANLKRITLDHVNKRVVLTSESETQYSPIIIAEEDKDYYRLLGVATGVIKAIPS